MRLFLKGIKKILGRYQKNRRGFVLVLTLMLITLLSVLTITSFEMVIATTQITGNHKRYLQALYAADAGVEHSVYVLNRANLNGDWDEIDWGESTLSLGSLSMHTNDEGNDNNWSISSNNLTWTMSNSQTGNNYSVRVYINHPIPDPDNNILADNFITVESTGTESGFTKTVIAEVVNSPTVRILRWRERDESNP